VSRPTLLAMACDQTTAGERAASPWLECGWGFGVGVWHERDSGAATPGRYGWDGGWGTTWRNDPAEELVAILMTQRMPGSRDWPEKVDFWTALYAAIDD
jgi:CubicO group peptidase (beta-lactamase class C family)